MTVQELIDQLQQIKDKKKEVCCISVNDDFYIQSVKEDIAAVYLEELK